MIARIKLTIDLEIRTKRKFWFDKKNYAKATYEGDLDVDELKIGETLQLNVLSSHPTDFEIRNIRKAPGADSKAVKGEIVLYLRSPSTYLDSKHNVHYYTIAESARKLRTTIADNLKLYGLLIQEEKCGVGDKPSYVTLPSSISSTSYLNAALQLKL